MLLVGTDLVLLMVWLANLLDLPARSVAGFRLDAGRRTVMAVHVGRLTASLIGLAAPPALAPTLRDEVRTRYATVLQLEFEASGEQAAYEAIRVDASADSAPVQGQESLRAILTRVHEVAGSMTARDAPTPAERELVRGVGRVQAATLGQRRPSPVLAQGQAATELRSGRLAPATGGPERAPAGGRQRAGAGKAGGRAGGGGGRERCPDPDPGPQRHRRHQVLQEYLSGIVESSPIKEVFFDWAQRLNFRQPSSEELPSAIQLMFSEPFKLAAVARIQVLQLRLTLIARGGAAYLPEPTAADGPPAVAAVDLVKEALILQARASSCCLGTGGRPVEQDRPRERPVRPVEPPPIHVR